MAKKKKQFIPLFEDYFDQLNLLSFDQVGRIFMLIRCCRSEPDQLLHLENSLDTGAKVIWSFIKSDLEAWFEAKKKKSETNAANARARWKSESPSSFADIPGQKSIIFTAEQAAPGSEPVLVAHAAGMRNNAVASENDAIASPIYNINNNIHNNNNRDIRPEEETPAASEFPVLETVVQLFLDNGSTKAAAEKYYNYYRIREWRTAKGELITNLEESVKRWIARDINFWRRRKARNVHPVTADASDHSHIGHTAAVPGASATYWDGTCSRPANAKKNSIRNFEQRNYDYNALQKVLCAI